MSYAGIENEELGAIAYRRGFPIEANPFRDNTQEANQFAKGWKREHKFNSRAAKRNQSLAKRNVEFGS